MNQASLIWMNGEFVPYEDAKVHVLTHALHYGTGVFEGVRAERVGGARVRHRLDRELHHRVARFGGRIAADRLAVSGAPRGERRREERQRHASGP